MKRKPQPVVSQKKRSRKPTPATHLSTPPPQPPTRTSSLTALEAKVRNAKYYKLDASLPPPILSGPTKSHYPVRSASFPSQPPPQTKPTTYEFSSATPQTTQLQNLLSVLSSAQNRNSVLSVLSLMDASKSSSATTSAGSTSNPKGSEDVFSMALKSLLSAASAASTSTNSIPIPNPPVALLTAPPDKLNDLPSPSSSGEDDTITPKLSAGSTPEDSSTACASPEVRHVEKGKAALDKENVHPAEHSTPSKSEKSDDEKVLSPVTSPSRPLGRSNTMTSPIRPIDVSSSSRRKRTISDVSDVDERVRDKVRLLRGSSTSGSTTFSFGDASADPLEGVKRRLFSLSSHYTAQYHSDPTFDLLPPSSSQGSTSSIASDCDRKPLIPSSSPSFIRSSWATAKVKSTNLSESELPSESSTIPSTTNAEGKKKFVVPDWAKTQTTTVPRLSGEAAAKLEAAEAEKIAQMKTNKKARSAAARKRKLEQMVVEDENVDRLSPTAKPRGKQKQGQTKPKAQERGPSFGLKNARLKNASNKPVTPKKNKPGSGDPIADLPLVASSSPVIFNSSPLASRSKDLVLKTPTRRRRNSSPSRTPTKRSATRAASESPLFTPDGTVGGITPKKLPSLFSTISPLRRGHKSPPILKSSSSSSVAKRVVIDLERDEDEGSNSLPNPSSDIDEPEAPVESLGRLAAPKLLSSSPPPSSPIATSSDMDPPPPGVVTSESSEAETAEEAKFEWFTTSTPACHPPSTTNSQQSDNDFVDFILQATSNSHHPPTAPSPSEASAAKFVSEIFDWGSDDTLAGSSSATPFDDFEFLENSDPTSSDVTQPLSTNLDFDYSSLGMDGLGGLGDVGAEFGIGEFWQSVKPLIQQSSLGSGGAPGADVGASGAELVVTGGEGNKLASGVADLFGGCLV